MYTIIGGIIAIIFIFFVIDLITEIIIKIFSKNKYKKKVAKDCIKYDAIGIIAFILGFTLCYCGIMTNII